MESKVPIAIPAAGLIWSRSNCSIARRLPVVGCSDSATVAVAGSTPRFGPEPPFDRLPFWRELRALSLEEQRHALADPSKREQLIQTASRGPYPQAIGGEARQPDFDRL